MGRFRIGNNSMISAVIMLSVVIQAVILSPAISRAELQCNGCHGTTSGPDNRPLDDWNRNPATGAFRGNHQTHLPPGTDASSCAKCHPGSTTYNASHRDGAIKLSSNINSSFETAIYNNSTSAFSQTATPILGSCTNVNCHFETKTDAWGSASFTAPDNCNSCHGFPPEDGSHPALTGSGKKHADYYGKTTSCSRCHGGHATFAHATSAGKRGLIVRFDAAPNSGGSYSGNTDYPGYLPNHHPSPRNGTCTDLYCHSNGNGGAANINPTWGGTLPEDCSGCHGGIKTSSPPIDSGKHGKHINYNFGCERCHNDTVSEATTIRDTSKHVNNNKEVVFREGGNFGADKGCTYTYCHSDARGGAPFQAVKWTDTDVSMTCISCHKGRKHESTAANCAAIQGTWSSAKEYCTPALTMSSNGHERLVGLRWIRKYPCSYCHYATVNAILDTNGKVISDVIGTGEINISMHMNTEKNVQMAPQWNITGKDPASYVANGKQCLNVYCHSDGTTTPDNVRSFGWQDGRTECNTCHGHPRGGCSAAGCHDNHVDSTGKTWTIKTGWPLGEEWKEAIPMYANQGPGTVRANSHMRHAQSDYTCDQCHAATIRTSDGITTCLGNGCHKAGEPLPNGGMSEKSHLDPAFHANKFKDVVFRRNPDGSQGSYDERTKTCSNTSCHTGGVDPQWGGSVNSAVTCVSCHGGSTDVDSFMFIRSGTQAKISMDEWYNTGHGRPASKGAYPSSGNPAANFPGNPCWYCHDNTVLHNYTTVNPFRLRHHQQFSNRFEKECVYCHMVGQDSECRSCHIAGESLAHQLTNLTADPSVTWPDGSVPSYDGVTGRPDHRGYVDSQVSCLTADCHYIDPANPKNDLKIHNTGAGSWDPVQKADIKNQYVMMGVCLKCHDDDSGGKCTSCHTAPPTNPLKYSIGFKPFSTATLVKPQKARASSVHFGYKHFKALQNGVTKGGKFCWDCHDPHGDNNIYMIQNQVATSTDGKFGIPRTRAEVSFTKKQSGLDYAKMSAPYNGICNVCHAALNDRLSKHFGSDYGDGHNAGRVCTTCHEHRFSDSHADNQPCNTCHQSKPVPRHSAFGQPRDCTKCHSGTINMRMDIMGQMNANSHHVQGITVTNKQCYACHWESTPEGLIDVRYHEGYNYKSYTSVKNAPVDLVVWKPGVRPTYKNSTTSVSFTASKIGTAEERAEVTKITGTCISCHSDQNNNTQPFGDCKTPRQYAWDGQSVAARYSQTGTAPWGKYNSTTFPNANQKDNITKALSAHGNAAANQGGYSVSNGTDSAIPNNRAGSQSVQCFDCHSSHGSKVVGVTSSYVTFNGTHNGGNLKETQAGKGGYAMTYKASANTETGAINPFNAGAGQCFDCHLTQNSGATPWGYQSTFGASAPIKGYFDSNMFGVSSNGTLEHSTFKQNRPNIGGHLKAATFLNRTTSAQHKINGLCTPCHDPHGVSPTLGSRQSYAVPLLKGTWLTSPYREDLPQAAGGAPPGGDPYAPVPPPIHTDQNTFSGQRINEDETQFAGLCLSCHSKNNLTDGTNHTWKSRDRVHESVKGWKTANGTVQHSYSCSKCHTPHTSGLKRLMVTNCLNYTHRGQVASGGGPGSGGDYEYADWGPAGWDSGNGSFPRGYMQRGVNCHPAGSWPDNSWNQVTPW